MKSLREIIPDNIIKLRKKLGLTQVGLAKKINFSDKAISRWEKGEVLPDIETLECLAKIFNVPLSYLLEEHSQEQSQKTEVLPKNEIVFQTLMVTAIWTIATFLFVFIELYYDIIFWQVFIWAIPVCCIIVDQFNKGSQNYLLEFLCRTIFCWTFITAFYLQFFSFNAWIVYFVGIPIEASITVSYIAKTNKKKKS